MTKRETARPGVAIDVQRQGDGQWSGRVLVKHKGRWVTYGCITPRATEKAARAAAIALIR